MHDTRIQPTITVLAVHSQTTQKMANKLGVRNANSTETQTCKIGKTEHIQSDNE
jgi:hypothetical protein